MKIKNSRQTYFGLTFLATSADTNGRYFLSETTVPVGDTGPPLHMHQNEDEGFYIVSGELTFIINNQEVKLKKGDYLNIEKGEEHTWRNDSQNETKMLIVFTPAGIENMFIELDEDMGNIEAIGSKYNTNFIF